MPEWNHWHHLNPDNFSTRVAVHIADVSYFVKEGTELDRAAGSRTTSTYLVQQVSVCVCNLYECKRQGISQVTM